MKIKLLMVVLCVGFIFVGCGDKNEKALAVASATIASKEAALKEAAAVISTKEAALKEAMNAIAVKDKELENAADALATKEAELKACLDAKSKKAVKPKRKANTTTVKPAAVAPTPVAVVVSEFPVTTVVAAAPAPVAKEEPCDERCKKNRVWDSNDQPHQPRAGTVSRRIF